MTIHPLKHLSRYGEIFLSADARLMFTVDGQDAVCWDNLLANEPGSGKPSAAAQMASLETLKAFKVSDLPVHENAGLFCRFDVSEDDAFHAHLKRTATVSFARLSPTTLRLQVVDREG
jgi:hypothetical protein